MTHSVAIIGFGAIGQDLVRRAQDDDAVHIAQVLVRPGKEAEVQAGLGPNQQAISLVGDLSADIDFVLECAGHQALRSLGPDLLNAGVNLSVLSIGALAEDVLLQSLHEAAQQSGSHISIVPGAIGGIDALAAAGPSNLSSVQYTGRKAPKSWLGTPAEAVCDLNSLSEPRVIFDGTARDAAQAFPKNANVVATVALAGLGFDATTVQLIADPSATQNTHHIQASGPIVSFDFTTSSGTLPSNPKSSALTSLSAFRALKQRTYALSV